MMTAVSNTVGSLQIHPRTPQHLWQAPAACERRHWRRQLRQQRLALTCHAEQPGGVVLYDAYDQLIPYEQAWKWQKDMVERVASRDGSLVSSSSGSEGGGSGDAAEGSSGSSALAPPLGAVVLLQHPPVYTLGTGSTEGNLKFDPSASPLPLYRTERGGEVTYHGPGQLVLYPILDLRRPPLRPDLHWYLRSLEEVVIRALDAVSGLHGERIPGLTGVWVGGSKVAALGVRASRWVTYHGLALNVVADLSPFQQIVPCGIGDRPVASVAGLLAAQGNAQGGEADAEGWGADPLAAGFGGSDSPDTASALAELVQGAPAAAAQADAALLEEYRHALLEAFEEVFGVQLTAADPARDDMAAQLAALGAAAATESGSSSSGSGSLGGSFAGAGQAVS